MKERYTEDLQRPADSRRDSIFGVSKSLPGSLGLGWIRPDLTTEEPAED